MMGKYIHGWLYGLLTLAVVAACAPDKPGAGAADARPNGTGGTDGPTCEQVTPVAFAQQPTPDLLLVVDKSGSMAQSLDGGDDKWTIMTSALRRAASEFEVGINFGLMAYPRGAACDAGWVLADIAEATTGAVVGTELDRLSPAGGTPSHATLEAALAYFQSRPVGMQGRYVLLATDGQPNCADGSAANDAVPETLTALRALNSAGIPVYVLGFGSDINSDPTTLAAMAQAGGTGTHFAANSPGELNAALDAIANQVGVEACTLELSGTPEDVDKLGVFFDDEQIPRTPSHTAGWDYDAASNSVTFYGPACDSLRRGDVTTIRVEFGCPGPVVL